MIGRFAGTFFMKFVSPPKLLAAYSVIVMILLLIAIVSAGMAAIYALIAVQFFLSIMFPNHLRVKCKRSGYKNKRRFITCNYVYCRWCYLSCYYGWVSDSSNIQIAYIVPAACLLMVLYFAIKNIRVTNVKLTAAPLVIYLRQTVTYTSNNF
jgi:FHS family L-fucose permease-like MFS transporter